MKPKESASRAARTAAITDAAPFTPHIHGMDGAFCILVVIQRIPPGKGNPIKNPTGAKIITVRKILVVNANPRVKFVIAGIKAGNIKRRITSNPRVNFKDTLLLKMLPIPENNNKVNKTVVIA